MTDSNQDVSTRIDRARREQMDVSQVTEDSLLVLQVYNSQSDRFHTVIPGSGHCSCEDHTYRHVVCKHLAAVLLHDEYGERAADELQAFHSDLESRANRIRDDLDELERELNRVLGTYDQITSALAEVSADMVRDETELDAIEMLQSGVTAGDAAIVDESRSDSSGTGETQRVSTDVDDSDAVDLTDEETRDELQTMVDELTGSDGDDR